MGCGRSAIGPRTVRLSASRALADGPPVDRGQSARGLLHGSLCAQVDSPVMDRGRSAHVQKGGVSQYLTYIGVSLSSFHQIRPHPLFFVIPLSLKHVVGALKVKVIWRDSRTVRAHPRTLRDILQYVLSVFCQIPNSCSWIS